MRRALALVALSLFVSLTVTAVMTLLARLEARSVVLEAMSLARTGESEKEVST